MTAGWMLSFDAAAPRTCVALGRLDQLTPEFVDEDEDGANQTSAHLHQRLAAVMHRAKISPRDLALLACGRGPGTFTGTRVGVSIAKGLAIGLGLAIVPVSTLAALAASAEYSGLVLALLDARRGQVYAGLFDCRTTVVPVGAERAVDVPTLLADSPAPIDGSVLAFGPGVEPHAMHLPASMQSRHARGPTGLGLWRASLAARQAGELADARTIEVRYLRLSYAEMGVHLPKRAVYKSPWA